MTNTQPETIGESPAYWTHRVETFPSPVAQFRMAQLVDMDARLYETARVVYRFMVGWYHDGYGDALLSQRHVAKVMKQRAPEGAEVPSRNAVQRAILALMETGWVVRTFQGRGKSKGASRYVPVMNVLELAAQGKFPEPAHANGPVEPAHLIGPVVAHANGPVEAEPAHATGPKTLLPDSATEPRTGMEDIDFVSPAPALAGGAATKGGFDELFDAYGLRKEYAAGRVEYEKLAPSADLHAQIVEAAKAWRAGAGGIERMHLARWLREHRFREEPKAAVVAKVKANSPAKSEAAPKTPAEVVDTKPRVPANWLLNKMNGQPRAGSYAVEVTDTDVTEFEAAIVATLTYTGIEQPYRGMQLRHVLLVQGTNQQLQDEGQRQLLAVTSAAGLQSVSDSDELLGAKMIVSIGSDGKLETATPYYEIEEAA